MAAFILRYYLVVFLSESVDNANQPTKIYARVMLKTRIKMLRVLRGLLCTSKKEARHGESQVWHCRLGVCQSPY
jgi:hypothetical protein